MKRKKKGKKQEETSKLVVALQPPRLTKEGAYTFEEEDKLTNKEIIALMGGLIMGILFLYNR